jgi:hypothetical protein
MHDSAGLHNSRFKTPSDRKNSTLLRDPQTCGPGFDGLHVVEAAEVGSDISEASVLIVQPPTLGSDSFVSCSTSACRSGARSNG